MSAKYKAAPPSDSDDDSLGDNEVSQKRLKLLQDSSESDEPTRRFKGGIIVSSESKANVHSATASLSVAEKKGKKEVEELKRELDLKNTFSDETNRRDEDAEMNKYIEEQIRLRREAAKSLDEPHDQQDDKRNTSKDLGEIFTLPSAEATEKVDDILLETLLRSHSSSTDEKSEAMLSSQMLNGIPEVDLGMSERIRTIEATEEAKLKMSGGSHRGGSGATKSLAPSNYSSNFQYHRQAKYKEDLKANQRSNTTNEGPKTVVEPVVSVGQEPLKVEYRVPTSGERRPPQKGKASDDYHLQKFKKNSRR